MRLGQGYKFAYEQEVGTNPEHPVQQDRVRVETVRMASGAKLLLAVIADGEGDANAGKAAEFVMDLIFETAQRSKKRDIQALLVDGLMAGNSAILGEGRVAATAVAIKNDRVYLAQSGHTSAFLVRKGESIPLTQPSDDLLGTSRSPRILIHSSKGEPLQADDSIVLCSDGLTMVNPDDGKPYVDPVDLPRLISDNTPLEAARHVISIAMGRDVADNVSVIVVQTSGKRRDGRRMWMLAAAFAAVVLLGVFIVLASNQQNVDETIEPVDHGYAVILSGSVFVETTDGEGKPVEKLGTVPPLTMVEAQQPTRLSLQSKIESSTDVPLISIYLSARSRMGIQSVDAYQDVDGQGTRFQSFPTSLTYIDGSLLVLRSGGVRRLQVEVGEIVVSMAGAGRTILGVRSSERMIQVDCLKGGCTYAGKQGEDILFQPRQSLTLSQSMDEALGVRAVLSDTLAFWDDLCGGCVQSP